MEYRRCVSRDSLLQRKSTTVNLSPEKAESIKLNKLTRAEKKARKKAQKKKMLSSQTAETVETAEMDPAETVLTAVPKKKKEKEKRTRPEDRVDHRIDPGSGIGGVIAAGLTVVKNTLDNVGRIELDPDLIGINPQVDSDLRNYRNIALLGSTPEI